MGADDGHPLIFISYSREDAAWLKRLQKHIKASLRQCSYTLWDDQGIQIGADWFDEIGKAIAAAQVAILLVSVDFLASDFIEKHEVKPLLERAERGELTVFLIPVRYADWEDRDFAKFQAACDPQSPLCGLNEHEQDVALTNIARMLKKHLGKPLRPSRKSKDEKPIPAHLTLLNQASSIITASPSQGGRQDRSIPKPASDVFELWLDQNQWIYLPPGSFTMGGPSWDKASKRVSVEKAYWLTRFPITNGVFADFIKAGCYRNKALWSNKGWHECIIQAWKHPDEWLNDDFNEADQPVVGVSVYEAEAFCNWLIQSHVPSWTNTRELAVSLPTERQWEYAACGQEGRQYPWGSQPPIQARANFNNIIGKTTPVDAHPLGATPEGLMGLAGNCWEWCRDSWGTNESRRVVRGGSWVVPARYLTTSSRDWFGCEFRLRELGFRCCLEAVPEDV